MKKFFVFLIKCICIFTLCYILLSIVLVILPNNKNLKHNYLASDIDKVNHLLQTPSPRIIFIGGSNLAFGLNSELIKDSLNMEPVNMGIHASIGLKYMFKEVIPYLTSGDILVITPEYEQFTKKTYYGEGTLSSLLTIKKEWTTLLTHTNWFTYPSSSLSILISDLIHYITNKSNIEAYDRIKFNQYGDYVGHWEFGHHTIPSSSSLDFFDSKVIEEIKETLLLLKHKGITTYIIPPCYRIQNYQQDSIVINSIQQILQKKEIPFYTNPKRYVFDDSLFYDTKYHLTKEGGLKRTLLLIEDLKRE
ncbi:hypothetical protein [Parabacteroides bouchesdurhonensis]|uniref:hypothetical protein n=1 Tax=Parabacteroides bouchesdurhonensis TaxID=1936995 RepID=UPI000C83A9E8|nr:hypothetical protein [Parabacteroides bouchesdurhonensis]